MNYDELRKNMVEQQLIARTDIIDKKVLEAFFKVPRHKFVSDKDQTSAYSDFPLPIGSGQTISQPYMVALMTQCLKLNGKEKVLEIGTGSGYQTAILAEIAKEVYTVERFAELSASAEKILNKLGYKNIRFKAGDGTLGWEEEAPFDGIIVTAGAPFVPKPLLDQLKDNGRLVIPVGPNLNQTLTVYTKKGNQIDSEQICGCMFVPLIGKEGWKDN
jgi:protein-L-isoaspartate(D-aspartate) O-methyltransferase